ncbi:hypothetical protein LCGC14_2770440 [marine sediment metagenome]|uniref:Uncharacterized protein n=1 Tax=marine sediment metagenome TaxID=412755 RepID=A0A0F9BMW3_9ZZZZ
MKTSVLQADDMEVGKYITVLQGRYYLADAGSGNMLLGMMLTAGEEEKQFNGMILQIIAIDLPYIVIVDLKGTAKHFDLREGWIFKALSQDYVNNYGNCVKDKKG